VNNDELIEHLHARGWSLDKIDVAMIREGAAAIQAEEASTMQVVAWRKTLRFQSGRVEYSFTWQKKDADDWARLGKPLEPMVLEADALAAIKAAKGN
jgi:broad-specificity NMP kinase